jgi:2-dehydropantoate 2-reductase
LDTVIIGAGAVGLALGSCLHRAGKPVRFLVRESSGRHAIEELGLVRSGIFGEVRVGAQDLEVLHAAGELRCARVDFLLVCTKSTASAEVAHALAGVWESLRGTPRLVLCQNGWGNAEVFAAHLPRERIYNARVITGFRRTQPHSVEVTVHADAIKIGSLFGADASPLEPLCRAISTGGVPCQLTAEIERDLWAKVLYNCLLNPLGALVGVPYGSLGDRAQTRAIMETVATEIFAVLAHAGFETHWSSAPEYLETFYRRLLPPTALHESSMLQDLRAGRPTEIDVLCGAVAELAARCGVPAPANQALAHLIRAAERREAI